MSPTPNRRIVAGNGTDFRVSREPTKVSPLVKASVQRFTLNELRLGAWLPGKATLLNAIPVSSARFMENNEGAKPFTKFPATPRLTE